MTDEPNPNPLQGRPGGQSDDELLRAFDALVGAEPPHPGSPSVESSGAACPEPGDWVKLALGEASPAESEAMLSHASICKACFTRLRAGLDAVSESASPEEQMELEQFATSSSQWQHRLAAELAQTPHRGRRAWTPRLFVWASTVAVMTAILVAALLSWWRFENNPSRLLAEAYTHSRTFDLRISGAGFAPVVAETHLRGAGDAGHDSPQLLTARAEIERKLEKTPADPYWLQLQARADLLDEKYDSAIDILDRLLAAGPVTATLLTDDASAYFQRGVATGSENDRATALDNLRRADELSPGDPVVLFNEACVMEDRGQLMNAVETWTRYLRFERDPRWKEEGSRRLRSLQEKLKKLQTHASRMEQHLATPQSMRALAADNATMAGLDEELSTTLLSRLLDAAFPLPGDRSRGSPCGDRCSAARALLQSLASSLERNHHDPWLREFLPSRFPLPNDDYPEAAHELGAAIDADARGAYAGAAQWSLNSRDLFHRLGNQAGEDRAEVERIYALQRLYTFDACHEAADNLLARMNHRYTWIVADATTLNAVCDIGPGTAAADNPLFEKGVDLARSSHYALLEMRAQAAVGSAAVESGDTETAWRLCIQSLRRFYQGDYPPFRAATVMAGLAYIEDATPRAQLDYLVNRETVQLFELARNRAILAEQRVALVRAAIRAGAQREAEKQMAMASQETSGTNAAGLQAEGELAMAGLYLDRADLKEAAHMLDSAQADMAHQDNSVQRRIYAAERGELELAEDHPETAEPILRIAILKEELEARGTGAENVIYARQNRDLYAVLAAVWLAEKRPPLDVLALWERYRLRILGEPVPSCPANQLDCLKPELMRALRETNQAVLLGQIVLRDRILLYSAKGGAVSWSQLPAQKSYTLAAVESVERVTNSPATSQASIDQAARHAGSLLLDRAVSSATPESLLLIESDPLLGNVPWAAVETNEGPIGLRFALEETPSILLNLETAATRPQRAESSNRPLVIGASDAAGEDVLLPEVLKEARTVAALEPGSELMLARQATEPQVAARLRSASSIHFAGHAAQFDGVTRLLLAPSGSSSDRPYLDRSLFLRDPPRDAKLVVFSACSTGKREEGWNHGMGDIVDTLAYLGVPEVVSTRWQIDSDSAVSMMDSFYRGLAAGQTVAQALTSARQSLVHDARYRHPYYWAAYYASGIGDTDVHEVFHGNSR